MLSDFCEYTGSHPKTLPTGLTQFDGHSVGRFSRYPLLGFSVPSASLQVGWRYFRQHLSTRLFRRCRTLGAFLP